MGSTYWIRRFIPAWVFAFVVIGASRLLRGHHLSFAVREGLIWGTFTAVLYLIVVYFRWRRACARGCDVPGRPGEPG